MGAESSRIIERIKSTLTSKSAKELLIFSLYVVLSAGMWFAKTSNEYKEDVVSIPVVYKNIPENVVITSNAPDEIRATLRDKAYNLLLYRIKGFDTPIVFDFENYSTKGSSFKITKDDLQKQLRDVLEKSNTLTSFKPESFDIVYTRGAGKKVPVYISGAITAKQQYEVTNTWATPDSVLIYAPQEILDTIKGMYTTLVSYQELTDSIRFKNELRSIQNVKAIPQEVEIHANVEQLTEKTLEVPVESINVPNGKVLRTFPAKVKVTFQTVLSYYKHVNSNNFIIQVDYNNIVRNPSAQIKPEVMAPSIIKHMRITPEVVEYLLEDENPQ